MNGVRSASHVYACMECSTRRHTGTDGKVNNAPILTEASCLILLVCCYGL